MILVNLAWPHWNMISIVGDFQRLLSSGNALMNMFSILGIFKFWMILRLHKIPYETECISVLIRTLANARGSVMTLANARETAQKSHSWGSFRMREDGSARRSHFDVERELPSKIRIYSFERNKSLRELTSKIRIYSFEKEQAQTVWYQIFQLWTLMWRRLIRR